jgi:tetratricopeptide (TPR) repeat protein
LGDVAYARGEYARARVCYAQSLAIFRELSEQSWTLRRLNDLGEISLASGDHEQAGERYREALVLAEELADLESISRAHGGLGEAAHAAGDVEAAKRCCRRALEAAMKDQCADAGLEALVSLARLAAHRGEQERAVELVALALNGRPGFWTGALRGTGALLCELRSGLSPEAYAAAQERGRARDLEATMVELLAELE